MRAGTDRRRAFWKRISAQQRSLTPTFCAVLATMRREQVDTASSSPYVPRRRPGPSAGASVIGRGVSLPQPPQPGPGLRRGTSHACMPGRIAVERFGSASFPNSALSPRAFCAVLARMRREQLGTSSPGLYVPRRRPGPSDGATVIGRGVSSPQSPQLGPGLRRGASHACWDGLRSSILEAYQSPKHARLPKPFPLCLRRCAGNRSVRHLQACTFPGEGRGPVPEHS